MKSEPGANACRHHWVLSAPEDERVVGRCKLCDAVRVYPAFGVEWEVPAERGEIIALSGNERFQENASEVMRWSA